MWVHGIFLSRQMLVEKIRFMWKGEGKPTLVKKLLSASDACFINSLQSFDI